MAAMSGLRIAETGTSRNCTGRPSAAVSARLIWSGVGASLASSIRRPVNGPGSARTSATNEPRSLRSSCCSG